MTDGPGKKFIAKAGQTDYTHAKVAPVINSVVEYGGKILLVRRSHTLGFYPEYWSGISGFLDDNSPPEKKLEEELKEELGLNDGDIKSIEPGQVFEVKDAIYDKTWVVHPLRAEIMRKDLHLNWEAEDYAWVLPHEIYNYELVPGYDRIVSIFYPDI